jgi:hypothetical protein
MIFNKIEKFAGYGFNKSHAISYALITYLCAYLKTYYPMQFYASALTFRDKDKLEDTVLEMQQFNSIKLSPPNVNKSGIGFMPILNQGIIYYGLEKLKGVKGVASSLVHTRERTGDYSTVADLIFRLKQEDGTAIDSTSFSVLSLCGALDSFIPRFVKSNRNINGRYFNIMIRDVIVSSKYYKDINSNISIEPIHYRLALFTPFEWFVYVITLANNKTKTELLKELSDSIGLESAIKPPKANALEHLTITLNHENTPLLTLYAQQLQKHNELSVFEKDFLFLYSYFTDIEENHNININDWFLSVLENRLNNPVIDCLEVEKESSGIYFTSTPLKILNIEDKAEMEPPSSYFNGCPIPVEKITTEFDNQVVMTYGIVKNMKTVACQKETSKIYGEPMVFFELHGDKGFIQVGVYGKKSVHKIKGKLSDNDIIVLSCLISVRPYSGDDQVSANLIAYKQYYPNPSEDIVAVK